MPKVYKLKILSVAETHWDSDCLACQQTSGFGPNQGTIRITIDLKSQIVIEKFNQGMQTVGSVVLKDFDIDGMLQYLQDVKQLISEQELVDKLIGRK